ncbi:MAG TPA: DUF1003 domain-containing protein [Candidatus Saccharimonadales bacterium]|nr:DUF1003 domain-containing protein [Candidatus Saccharimonadales bacterium]
MANPYKFTLSLVAINKNDQVKKLRTFSDRIADKVTAIAGSTPFLVLNIAWFVAWVLMNIGVFGERLIFDEYPFGFLTMVVSLEAIILSVFVLISQNRQSKRAEIRAELDYLTDLQADAEVATIISIMERLAEKQNIDVSDLLENLAVNQKRILKEHPITKKDLDI